MPDSFLEELSRPKNKFEIKTTEEYYKSIQNEFENFTRVNKNLKNLDVAEASGIDISAKFLKDGAPVIAH